MSLRATSLGYRVGDRALLGGVTLELAPGEVLGVIGPNGAGKSTLLKLLAGLLKPTAGEVRLEGTPLCRLPRREVARRLAVVSQQHDPPEGYTVGEIVRMGRAPYLGFLSPERPHDLEAVAAALARCRLQPFVERRVETLSGGERQRVMLALALAQTPRYLLLDEPSSHLDVRHQLELLRLVRQVAAEGVGVLVVLHDLNLAARACDRLLVLGSGRVLAEGAPPEVISEALVARVYGVAAKVWREVESGAPVVLPQL